MKTSKKIISLLLSAAIIMSAMVITAVSAAAAADGSEVYFDNSVFNWENVYIYAYGTKENAKWPGQLMSATDDGLYKASFTSAYKSESIIFNNGKEKDEGKEQYPKASGLSLKAGQCKLLTAAKQWVDYGKPDSHGYGIVYKASGTSFSSEFLQVQLGLKNASVGYYSVDGSAKKSYTDGTIIKIGEGKIGNSEITLVLTATGDDGVETTQTFTYNKTFTAGKTTFSADSDGHTTAPESGYYGTNPNMQLGKYKAISVDGDVSDWDSSMIIAQGTANDDPRVYMPSSMHELPWDSYALYGAWDDENLYFMCEMANTTYITSPNDNFAASNEARPWRNSIPMYIALSIDPSKQATGKAVGTNKDGSVYTNPFVWGCDGGVAKDGGVGFTTHIDTLVAFDSNNSNGGASIFKADVQDTDGTYLFDYDTRVPIGVTSYQAQDNRNGFKIKFANGTKSETLYGVREVKGDRTLGDNTDPNSNWVDFFKLGYKKNYGYVYEVAIPYSALGIDRNYVETQGIGAMQILTYGTSGMDTLPHDPSMLDVADAEYSYDPSTSHEKEDIDNITVPLARLGKILPDTQVQEAEFEVNFGADKSSSQPVGTALELKAEPYNNHGNVTYEFAVNGATVKTSSDNTYNFTANNAGTYTLSVKAVDSDGCIAESTKSFYISDGGEQETILKGDVNRDGVVDVNDVTHLQIHISNDDKNPLIDVTNKAWFDAADMYGDGKLDILDATELQIYIA